MIAAAGRTTRPKSRRVREHGYATCHNRVRQAELRPGMIDKVVSWAGYG